MGASISLRFIYEKIIFIGDYMNRTQPATPAWTWR